MMSNQQLVEKNFEEKIRQFVEVINGEFKCDEGFAVANTGLSTDTFNTVLVKTGDSRCLAKVQEGIDIFHKKALPFSVWLDVNHVNDALLDMLEQGHLSESERNIMMKRQDTLHVEAANSQQLTIKAVKHEAALSDYVDVFTSLFAGTEEAKALATYFNAFSLEKLSQNVQMFVGYNENQAVSTGLLIESKESYGIYDVMTKENARGQGLGSEMFRFLLTQTKDKEKPVVLQASDDGKNIYKRFGFKEVGEMVVLE